VKVDVKKKKVEYVDDGLPFPTFPPIEEPIAINTSEAKKLLDYAKRMGWI